MKRVESFALVLLLAACSKTPELSPEPKPSTSASTSTSAVPVASAPSKPHAGGDDIAFDPPAAWQQMPNPNPMRKATFKVPKTGGDADDGELTLSAALGGVEKNVERWGKQFGDAKPTTEKKKIGAFEVTMVTIKGKYGGGGPMMGGAGGAAAAPKEGYMLLGAIIEDPSQPNAQAHFFKLVGPEKTLTAAKPDFEKLVASVRAK